MRFNLARGIQPDFHPRVVVVTGASSGIGRATALAFARSGETVVLVARRESALEMLAGECMALGGKALAAPLDVTDEQAVRRLAASTVERFGRLDTWVNNAGVYLVGRLEEVPMVDFQRVMEVNLLGYVHGARASLPHFRAQGSGVLINNASVDGVTSFPYASAYVCSKWAVRGLSMSLRQECRGSGIQVCTVLPSAIDTPLFQNAGNYLGKMIKAPSPVYEPEQVAKTIVRLSIRPRGEVVVGGAGRLIALCALIAPRMMEQLVAWWVDRDHVRWDVEVSATSGNLFQPLPSGGTVSGGWKMPRRFSVGIARRRPQTRTH